MEALKKQLRRWVTSAESRNWTKAFEKIQDLDESETQGIIDEVLGLQAKFNRVEDDLMNAFISDNDADVARSRMTKTFLKYIKLLGTDRAKNPPPEPVPEGGTAPPPEPTTKILFLAANPMSSGRLQLDKETRDIKEAIRLSNNRDKIEIIKYEAIRPKDLTRALLNEEPNIIHFSGHGVTFKEEMKAQAGTRGLDEDDEDENQGPDLTGQSGGIMVQDDNDFAKIIKAEALAALFLAVEGDIDCVILNACYSKVQADALIGAGIPYVIGMNDAVPDTTAITFATRFYDAIGAGKAIKTAFNVAKAALLIEELPGADIPELMKGPE